MILGNLYIVATPIGNLADITLRALEILKSVDLIAAEDTRHSSKLLQHYGIVKPLVSLHDFNETKRSELLITKLQEGKNVALISDAGTPLISDPGYHLVTKVRAAEIKVVPIPGPCAAITALSASGLSTEKFIFEGFLPAKIHALRARLEELVSETRTIIFYESPHRLLQTLYQMQEVFGGTRNLVLAKELTKTFETIYSATISAVITWLEADAQRQKGEFVILIDGAEPNNSVVIDAETQRVLKLLLVELPPKKAVKLTAEITGADKSELYKLAIMYKQE